jgi:hypothetical protein
MDAHCEKEIYFVSLMILSVLPSSVCTSKPDDYPRVSIHVALYKKKYGFLVKIAVLIALSLKSSQNVASVALFITVPLPHMRKSKQANKSSTLGLWEESEGNCEIPVLKTPFAQRHLN